MNRGEQQPSQSAQQTEEVSPVPANPLPVIGGDQWNKDITAILTSNTNDALAELGFNPNVLHALKDADNSVTKLKTENRILEIRNRELSAHLALANNRIDFSKESPHTMWRDVIFHREKYHVLQRQHQELSRAHSEFEKLQHMHRNILAQNTTLKFEVQRLMQQCVNAGLIPPPQNYLVTAIPALCPPSVQPGAARRVSEPAVGQRQLQSPVQHGQMVQPGPVARQFTSPPSNLYTANPSVTNNPAIVAGPIQAYNFHRAQLPQSQQLAAQLMPPPQPQGQPSVFQQQIPATRPRQVIDLTGSHDERVPKRPRMASDPNVYIQNAPESVTHLQHQAYARMAVPASYQIPQQRIPQPRAQVPPMDHTQAQFTQQYYLQRTGPYQQAPSLTPSTHVGQYRANALSNVPTPLATDAYGAAAGEQGAPQLQGQLFNGRMQAIGQPSQVYTDPAHFANVASPIIDAGTDHIETSTERSKGTPVEPISPRVTTNGHTHGGESSLPSLTEGQTMQMRSEVADSMFTEPQEGDGTQSRTCMLCNRRRELGILADSPQPLLEPTTEEMYSHLQAEHSESLETEENDWKMELFGMDTSSDQPQ